MVYLRKLSIPIRSKIFLKYEFGSGSSSKLGEYVLLKNTKI